MTRQRDAVADALAQASGFVTAQDLHARLRADGVRVGLTTVYRHLAALVAEGEVDALRTADGETAYRRCESSRHHHHLVCRECGRTVEVEGAGVERWASSIASRHGFRDVEHTVEVFGTCERC